MHFPDKGDDVNEVARLFYTNSNRFLPAFLIKISGGHSTTFSMSLRSLVRLPNRLLFQPSSRRTISATTCTMAANTQKSEVGQVISDVTKQEGGSSKGTTLLLSLSMTLVPLLTTIRLHRSSNAIPSYQTTQPRRRSCHHWF